MILDNQLQSSNVYVYVELYPELRRYCANALRISSILDVVIIILLIITGMIYFLSIYNTVKLSTVSRPRLIVVSREAKKEQSESPKQNA